MQPGKRWENNIKSTLGRVCTRLYDTTNGFTGIKNPCDFIYYSYPHVIYIEAKTVQNKRLPFRNITDYQLEELYFLSSQFGCIAGIAVEFRDEREGYFIPIQLIHRMIQKGKKSITIEDCRTSLVVVNMMLDYKRTNCTFNTQRFNKEVQIRCFKYIGIGGNNSETPTDN